MDDSPGTSRSGNLQTYVQLHGEYRGREHMQRIGRQLGLRQAYWQLRRFGMAMLFCLPAGWMLLAGLASGNLVYCLGGIGILYYYYFRVHLDSAGMARVEYFMQNARHYLLDKGLLIELLQADRPEWLLEQDRSLELARLKAKERPSFTDTIQRLEFLVEHYALICDERGWQWRERVQKSAGRLKAGEERKREPRLLPWERQALVGVLIDILEDRPRGQSGPNLPGLQ
ncbi:hypothetical protein KDL29_03940 [bacterium]|nr:hypothetical protein [bacterium]